MKSKIFILIVSFISFQAVSIETKKTGKLTECIFNIWARSRVKNKLSEMVNAFNNDKNFYFYDGDIGIRPVTQNDFETGDTFTVIILTAKDFKSNHPYIKAMVGAHNVNNPGEDVIVVGKNIKGTLADKNKVGGSGSHETLSDKFGVAYPTDFKDPEAGGGAFGIKDGTVYISGFHDKTESPEAAKRIEKFFKRICPNCKFKNTGKKLKEIF